MTNWEIIKKKQAENIEKLYKKNPDDWFYKYEMSKPVEKRTGFAPSSGVCWKCHQNIAEGEHAITLEKLGDYIITNCPHCHRSFCD